MFCQRNDKMPENLLKAKPRAVPFHPEIEISLYFSSKERVRAEFSGHGEKPNLRRRPCVCSGSMKAEQRRISGPFVIGLGLLWPARIIDEAQDLSVNEGPLGVLTGKKPNGLFVAGVLGLGQRIFQQPFSWNAMSPHGGFDQRSRNMRVSWSVTGLKR
jgi:hypothetical protein